MADDKFVKLLGPDTMGQCVLQRPKAVKFFSGVALYDPTKIQVLKLEHTLKDTQGDLKTKESRGLCLTRFAGLAFPLDSEIQPLFDYYVLRLIEHGVIRRLRSVWLETTKDVDDGVTAVSLGFENLLFPTLVLAVALGRSPTPLSVGRCRVRFLGRR